MFNFFKKQPIDEKQPVGETKIFKIAGMHCASCSLNIDGLLEDTPGVYEANTNYAQAVATINFDSKKVTAEKLKSLIESLGYTVVA